MDLPLISTTLTEQYDALGRMEAVPGGLDVA